jgi:hypothetical protein
VTDQSRVTHRLAAAGDWYGGDVFPDRDDGDPFELVLDILTPDRARQLSAEEWTELYAQHDQYMV